MPSRHACATAAEAHPHAGHDVDVEGRQVLGRAVLQHLVKCGQDAAAGLHEAHFRERHHVAVVPQHLVEQKVAHRARKLDARRPAADYHEAQCAPQLLLVSQELRSLELRRDALAQPHAVGYFLHEERVVSHARHAEGGRLLANGDHKVLVGDAEAEARDVCRHEAAALAHHELLRNVDAARGGLEVRHIRVGRAHCAHTGPLTHDLTEIHKGHAWRGSVGPDMHDSGVGARESGWDEVVAHTWFEEAPELD